MKIIAEYLVILPLTYWATKLDPKTDVLVKAVELANGEYYRESWNKGNVHYHKIDKELFFEQNSILDLENRNMGLDVSVYHNIKLMDNIIDEEDFDYDFKAFVIDDDWLDRIKNLEVDRYYSGDNVGHLISYAYSTHNRFRELLLRIIGQEKLLLECGRVNWDKLEPKKELPFYELIWFADNEGVLDWEVSEKLFFDFKTYEEKALEYLSDNEWMRDSYLNWMEAFELGKDNGVVVFR